MVEGNVALGVRHEVAGQRQRGQVAHRDFVLVGVLNNLGAQVARLNRAQVLLVRLAVGRILEQHVGRTRLGLAFQNSEPQLLRLDGAAATALLLIKVVKLLELRTPGGVEAGALVRAHQGPVAVFLHALHEQIGRPHGVKQVAGAHFLLAVVLLQVQEFENVGVPGL